MCPFLFTSLVPDVEFWERKKTKKENTKIINLLLSRNQSQICKRERRLRRESGDSEEEKEMPEGDLQSEEQTKDFQDNAVYIRIELSIDCM